MTTGARLLVFALVGATLTVAAGVGIATASIATAGTIAVEVQEHRGGNVSVHVPAGLVSLALFFVPDHVVDRAVDELDHNAYRQVEAYVPAIRSAWTELAEAPDFVVVEIESSSDHVRVEKRDGRILVSVASDDADIHVSFPLSTVERLLRKI